jgi:hypothetical protein
MPSRETKMPLQQDPLRPPKAKVRPWNRSRSAAAPRTGHNDSKTDLAVDGIDLHGSGTSY